MMFYNDPDSYHYLSIGLRQIQPENILLDKILYAYGINAGIFACFIAWILCGLILYSILYSRSKEHMSSIIFSFAFICTPFIFFLNGWMYILDKNIFCLLIFMLLLHYHLVWKLEDAWICTSYIFLIYALSSMLWSGWMIFIVFSLLFNIVYLIFHFKNFDDKDEISISIDNFDESLRPNLIKIQVTFLICVGLFALLKLGIKNSQFIQEMHTSLLVFLALEILISIILFYIYYEKMSRGFISVYITILAAGVIFPRMFMFIAPLTYMMIYSLWKYEDNKLLSAALVIIIFSQAIGFSQYYQHDAYTGISQINDPCVSAYVNYSNCTIISNWDNGHVIKYYFPQHKVKYLAHPNNVNMMLDLLYYKNYSCRDCVLLYVKGDEEKLRYIADNR